MRLKLETIFHPSEHLRLDSYLVGYSGQAMQKHCTLALLSLSDLKRSKTTSANKSVQLQFIGISLLPNRGSEMHHKNQPFMSVSPHRVPILDFEALEHLSVPP